MGIVQSFPQPEIFYRAVRAQPKADNLRWIFTVAVLGNTVDSTAQCNVTLQISEENFF
jgi:hypothetical protein